MGPQDKVLLTNAKTSFEKNFQENAKRKKENTTSVLGEEFQIKDGSIVIAAITSCTNTSNPNVLIGAGLLAKNAIEKGLQTKLCL